MSFRPAQQLEAPAASGLPQPCWLFALQAMSPKGRACCCSQCVPRRGVTWGSLQDPPAKEVQVRTHCSRESSPHPGAWAPARSCRPTECPVLFQGPFCQRGTRHLQPAPHSRAAGLHPRPHHPCHLPQLEPPHRPRPHCQPEEPRGPATMRALYRDWPLRWLGPS